MEYSIGTQKNYSCDTYAQVYHLYHTVSIMLHCNTL